MIYVLEGKLFDVNIPQLVGDNQYPAGWFNDADARSEYGIEPVQEVVPNYNPMTQMATQLLPILVDGVWIQQWQITSLDPTIIAANTSYEQSAEVGAIQDRLDSYARSWGYDNIISACTYLNDPFPKFANEAEALRTWRSAVWQYVEETAASIIAGETQPPDSVEAALAMIPDAPIRPI